MAYYYGDLWDLEDYDTFRVIEKTGEITLERVLDNANTVPQYVVSICAMSCSDGFVYPHCLQQTTSMSCFFLR